MDHYAHSNCTFYSTQYAVRSTLGPECSGETIYKAVPVCDCFPLPYPPPTRNRIGATLRTIGNNLPPFLGCAHRCSCFYGCFFGDRGSRRKMLCFEFGPALQVPQCTPQSPPKSLGACVPVYKDYWGASGEGPSPLPG